jgi:16S rRNA (guanine527-N7)-methyltransferase
MKEDCRHKLLVQLKYGIETLQVPMRDASLVKLLAFMEILLKWNKAYNLTAIDRPEDILTHHFLDSLSIVPYIQGDTILDVGSGGGFPGIPCALALLEKRFTLLDSHGKKTRFLTQAVGELQLANVTVVQNRVENYAPIKCFDTIMARAFSSLDHILTCTRHLYCPEGELLIMKGAYPQAELQNITNHVTVHALKVPGLQERRHLVCIKGFFDE